MCCYSFPLGIYSVFFQFWQWGVMLVALVRQWNWISQNTHSIMLFHYCHKGCNYIRRIVHKGNKHRTIQTLILPYFITYAMKNIRLKKQQMATVISKSPTASASSSYLQSPCLQSSSKDTQWSSPLHFLHQNLHHILVRDIHHTT